MDFGRRLGASDEHIPKWICKERATTPPPKRHAALRVALKLAWGFVAQSVEYRWGYTPSFTPRPRPISAQRMYTYFRDTTLVGILDAIAEVASVTGGPVSRADATILDQIGRDERFSQAIVCCGSRKQVS